jgi:hypothetical protein
MNRTWSRERQDTTAPPARASLYVTEYNALS